MECNGNILYTLLNCCNKCVNAVFCWWNLNDMKMNIMNKLNYQFNVVVSRFQ